MCIIIRIFSPIFLLCLFPFNIFCISILQRRICLLFSNLLLPFLYFNLIVNIIYLCTVSLVYIKFFIFNVLSFVFYFCLFSMSVPLNRFLFRTVLFCLLLSFNLKRKATKQNSQQYWQKVTKVNINKTRPATRDDISHLSTRRRLKINVIKMTIPIILIRKDERTH